MEAFQLLCRTEGIIPAIESAHALAGALRVVPKLAAELGRERSSWSTCPAAATRTSTPPASWFGILDEEQ